MLELARIGGVPVDELYDASGDRKATLSKFHLKENIWREGDLEYTVLQYTRPIRDEEHGAAVGHLRSVIHRAGKIVCVAPPRGETMERFAAHHAASTCVAEEIIEGTMVNLFYDEGDWRLATRGTVGARNWFYRGAPTFRHMFLETAGLAGLDFDRLPKDCCYSFVLQHPENRIVSRIRVPQLYIVDRYLIDQDTRAATRLPSSDALKALLADTSIRFPESWPISDFEAARIVYAGSTTKHTIPGVMFRDKETGARARACNPNYEAVRQLRGNHPKEQYRYLVLRKEGRVDEYLRFYPEDREAFEAFGKQVAAFIKQLHSSYIQARPMRGGDDAVERHLLPHVRGLHKIYLSRLREEGRKVHRGTVTDYVADLPPARLMFAINYPLRDKPDEAATAVNVASEAADYDVVEVEQA